MSYIYISNLFVYVVTCRILTKDVTIDVYIGDQKQLIQ